MLHIQSITNHVKNWLLKIYIHRFQLPSNKNPQKPTSLISKHQRSLWLALLSFFTMAALSKSGTPIGIYTSLIAGILMVFFTIQHIIVSIRLRRKIINKMERFLDE